MYVFVLCNDFTFVIFCPLCAQIVVLITNGPSDNQVDAAARAVADNGISLFAVGECGSWYCEFLQHPHCSQAFRFYPSSAGLSAVFAVRKFMSCIFEFIGFSVGICKNV